MTVTGETVREITDKERIIILEKNLMAVLETLTGYGKIFDELRMRLNNGESRQTMLDQRLTMISQQTQALQRFGMGPTQNDDIDRLG